MFWVCINAIHQSTQALVRWVYSWVYSLHIEKQVDWIRPMKAIDDDH